MAIIDNNNHYGFDTYWCICPLLITINETYWKKITVQSANIIMITHNYLDYIHIQNKYNFNLVLNDDKVTCCLILTGKLFHKNTPLCRITFDVIWRLQKFTCNLLVCRVVILCIVLVLVNILFNTSGSIPVLNLYIITNTHCLYIALKLRKFNIVNNKAELVRGGIEVIILHASFCTFSTDAM